MAKVAAATSARAITASRSSFCLGRTRLTMAMTRPRVIYLTTILQRVRVSREISILISFEKVIENVNTILIKENIFTQIAKIIKNKILNIKNEIIKNEILNIKNIDTIYLVISSNS
jgi:hypothetical protein